MEEVMTTVYSGNVYHKWKQAQATAYRLRALLRELAEWTSDVVPNELEERVAKELADD